LKTEAEPSTKTWYYVESGRSPKTEDNVNIAVVQNVYVTFSFTAISIESFSQVCEIENEVKHNHTTDTSVPCQMFRTSE